MKQINRIIEGLEKIASTPGSDDVYTRLSNWAKASDILTNASRELSYIKDIIDQEAVKDIIKSGNEDCLTINKSRLKRRIGS